VEDKVEDKVEKTDEDGEKKAVVAAEAVAEATQDPAVAPAASSTPAPPGSTPFPELGEGKVEKEDNKNSVDVEQGTFDQKIEASIFVQHTRNTVYSIFLKGPYA
jgi:hypothetical protein